MPYRVLVIEGDCESTVAAVHVDLMLDASLVCERTSWRDLQPQRLDRRDIDLIVAVAPSHNPAVVGVFESLRQQPVRMPMFAVLPENPDEPLLYAISKIVDEFILQPIRPIELRHRLQRVLAEPRHDLEVARRTLLEKLSATQLVGRDPAFLAAIDQVPRFAKAEAPVLITGETGTGKEVCARALHHLGRRRRFPFMAVDCSTVPDQLFENELFGHARGAFTDAHRERKGLVAMAAGGTLFLDEIDALSLAAQAKLLRFLQEHSYRPLGSDRFDRADVKVIAASNRDLDTAVREKQFRSDLYFRLNVLRIQLPPLRARRGDIDLLAYNALRECGASIDTAATSFSPAALRALVAYDWPGNVRELCNVVHRAVVACDGDRILPIHLALANNESAAERPALGHFREQRAAAVAAFERGYIEELLRRHHGNVTHAAREAHQDRRAFGRFMK
jgi:two-component system, NtrC family, response regulator GlrR